MSNHTVTKMVRRDLIVDNCYGNDTVYFHNGMKRHLGRPIQVTTNIFGNPTLYMDAEGYMWHEEMFEGGSKMKTVIPKTEAQVELNADIKKANDTINPKMLEIMSRPATKEAGLSVRLVLKDGTKRKGIYMDLGPDPLKRYDFRNTEFITFRVNKGEHDIVYLPLTLIATIEWSL